MNFITEFIEELEREKSNLSLLLGEYEPNDLEIMLREQLFTHWHRLPKEEDLSTTEYAVDSSSASRSLISGLDLFIIRSLMLGSNGLLKKKLEFEFMRGVTDPDLSSRFERMMRDLLEIQIVIENCPNSPGDIVLIDGNLYGRYTWIHRQLDLANHEVLPLLLWDAMQQMFEACSRKGILVIGVSKFSKTRTLCNAFLRELGYPFGTLDIPDVGMIYRWNRGNPGFTTPLILGDYGFKDEALEMSRSPRRYLRKNFGDFYARATRERRDWAQNVIEKVPQAPAIVMFHLVPSEDEHPLRIDVPINCLGFKDRIFDVSPLRFGDPSLVEHVVSNLLADRGGMDVYNALLYVVDREVRLGADVVDNVYRSILRRELDMPVEYDRSSRRLYR